MKISIQQVIQEIFYVLTGALVIFGLLELIWPRSVMSYINLNWLLILWFFNVILLLLISYKKE